MTAPLLPFLFLCIFFCAPGRIPPSIFCPSFSPALLAISAAASLDIVLRINPLRFQCYPERPKLASVQFFRLPKLFSQARLFDASGPESCSQPASPHIWRRALLSGTSFYAPGFLTGRLWEGRPPSTGPLLIGTVLPEEPKSAGHPGRRTGQTGANGTPQPR